MSAKQARYRRAIALEYDETEGEAPLVTVKGERLSADEIVRIAKRYGVPVVEDPALAEGLDSVEEDDSIPEKLYRAVAVVLSALGVKRKQA